VLGEHLLRVPDGPPRRGLARLGDDFSEQFAIDEIGGADEDDADGPGEAEDIDDVERADAVTPGDPPGGGGEALASSVAASTASATSASIASITASAIPKSMSRLR